MPASKKINRPVTVSKVEADSGSLPRVALIVETSTLFGRRLLSGVAQYMRENGRWSVFFTDRAVNDSTPSWLSQWQGDGIISRIASPEIRQLVQKRRIPVVDLNEQLGGMEIPQISNDHAAVGRMAAKHLLERGFRRFAFLGHAGYPWSDRREIAFSKTVKDAGHPCSVYTGKASDLRALREGTWEMDVDRIAAWAKALPKPVGMMACNDFRALQLLSACRLAGIAVPEQAAVIGVGADDVACELADPPLSSVMLNAWQMGYEAAALLDKLMRGGTAPRGEMVIPPLDVAARRSTDVTAIDHPVVAQAVRFIRDSSHKGINVEDVVRALGVSRTSLQGYFRDSVGKSIHDVLIETKVARVKELLAETQLSIEDTALRCGFRHPEYMSAIFKQRTGWTPARYRQQFSRKAAL
jgi:LacI family transcriptional regulator